MDERPGSLMDSPSVSSWLGQLRRNTASNSTDCPNYYIQDLESLQTKSRVHVFMVGTGADIFEQLRSSIESAEKEVVLITCFWAPSPSLDLLVGSLRRLSQKAERGGTGKRIRVFIGLSSLSICQKLFQTSSLRGKTYGPQTWTTKLGLPSASELPGLDLRVKSIFVRPFSVMHPKFLVIDRKVAWLPSCNVSWEPWFEGATVLSGPIIRKFVQFWQEFWLDSPSADWNGQLDVIGTESALDLIGMETNTLVVKVLGDGEDIESFFLLSPHHANPRFRPIFFKLPPKPPSTPLNLFLLVHIRSAKSYIFIQTPNLTAPPILTGLLEALRRGVDIRIVVSEKLMILEQLCTAGTTTTRCVNDLVRAYEKTRKLARQTDVELGITKLGTLRIEYFKPRNGISLGQPVQSHIKLTIIDEEVTVLGSQNMDRASWYTSQELSIAFKSRDIARVVKATLDAGMMGRTKLRFDSSLSGSQ
jgi:phosphatidylserine/phosphatidylglycerophosphate/cardiolipin synthase-like enzyme